ncbi:STAS domain-containing protein [Actinoplanes awajinensis]|uniref:STAS domain-containing protein n=1 Tax=Actinoplanes awajinensis subsp. mycoplanecinus TaxID=135947 RepID=A0A117MPZ1_9ACTN|nr:STAS domain-containing protein [Actinoplanes awajinensis]KUL29442.1 hypothetical protein ADL15_27890 [Actinoplanes awajinensis subsp. mycoplanecinus]
MITSDCPSLIVDLDGRPDGVAVIYVKGELGSESVAEFRTRIATVLAGSDADKIFLDLSDVSFCDCAGMRALEALESDHAKVGPVRIVAAGEAVDILVRILGGAPLLGYVPGMTTGADGSFTG